MRDMRPERLPEGGDDRSRVARSAPTGRLGTERVPLRGAAVQPARLHPAVPSPPVTLYSAGDVLDLPEPLSDPGHSKTPDPILRPIPVPPLATASPSAGYADDFDHRAWAADLDALLQRALDEPISPPPSPARPAVQQGSEVARGDAVAGMKPAQHHSGTRSAPRSVIIDKSRRVASWKASALIILSAVGMAVVVGGAALALSSPEVTRWLAGATEAASKAAEKIFPHAK